MGEPFTSATGLTPAMGEETQGRAHSSGEWRATCGKQGMREKASVYVSPCTHMPAHMSVDVYLWNAERFCIKWPPGSYLWRMCPLHICGLFFMFSRKGGVLASGVLKLHLLDKILTKFFFYLLRRNFLTKKPWGHFPQSKPQYLSCSSFSSPSKWTKKSSPHYGTVQFSPKRGQSSLLVCENILGGVWMLL